MTHLEPCPFCGTIDLQVYDNCVNCRNPDCGAAGPDIGHCVGLEARAESVALWNKRAPITAKEQKP